MAKAEAWLSLRKRERADFWKAQASLLLKYQQGQTPVILSGIISIESQILQKRDLYTLETYLKLYGLMYVSFDFVYFSLMSWESLRLQGDPTSQSYRKSVMNIHWKLWYWSWNSNTLATSCEELTHLKRPWCWEWLKVEEKWMTEDEMVGWHQWCDGHEFE